MFDAGTASYVDEWVDNTLWDGGSIPHERACESRIPRTSPTQIELARYLESYFSPSTGGNNFFAVLSNSFQGSLSEEKVPAISEQLVAIKSSLGLNLSQLSHVIGVSRPQLNKWLSGDVIPKGNDSNRKIDLLYSFCASVPKESSSYIGKLASRYVSPEESLLDFLSKDSISESDLWAVFRLISQDIEKLRAKRFSKPVSRSYNALPMS